MLNQAAILVGGRGRRLGPLTETCPKPLLPVGGRPFLDTVIDLLMRHRITDILLLGGYQGDLLLHYAEARRRQGLRLRCLVEPVPLGTGGALAFAEPHLAERFLVLNGDTLFLTDLAALASAAAASPLPAIMGLHRVAEAARYGTATVADGRVVAFGAKGNPGPGLINAGVYGLDRCLIGDFPPGCSSIEQDVFPALASAGRLGGHLMDGYFIDIGVPADFERAQSEVPMAMRRPAIILDRAAIFEGDRISRVALESGCLAPVIPVIRRLNDLNSYTFLVDVDDDAGWEATTTVFQGFQEALAREGAHLDACFRLARTPPAAAGGALEPRSQIGAATIADLQGWPILWSDSLVLYRRPAIADALQPLGCPMLPWAQALADDVIGVMTAAARSPFRLGSERSLTHG